MSFMIRLVRSLRNDWRRHLSLAVGAMVNLCTGTTYLVGIYGPELKDRMHYSETITTMLETTILIGLYTGLVGGLFFDKYGGEDSMAVSGFFIFVGYV